VTDGSSAPQLRLVMMGTGPFAAPTFRALFDTPHAVLVLVTQPRRDVAREKSAPEPPMRALAHERGTPVLDPADINTADAREALARLSPDLFIVADYGQILSEETLAVARFGGINLHGSLLPKYRGAAPINWAIYHGDAETGVTVIHMTPRVDAGPTLAQAHVQIGAEEDAVELEHRLAELGAPLVARSIGELAAGRRAALPQDSAQASPARRLRKTDGIIDWSRSAVEIKNQVRALEPWPKTYTFWPRAEGPLRLILGRVSVADAPPEEGAMSNVAPGKVLKANGDNLLIATGAGPLAVHQLQPAGKRMLSVSEFVRGYPLAVGDTLVASPS
jgi:methionyl-tRNA formyltransferase